jgi:hypothetical protein
MRKLGIVLAALACLSLLSVAPAIAMNWSIGANLGYEMAMPTAEGAHSVSSIGWPMGGLRLGFVGEKPAHEVYLLSSVSLMSSDGSSSSSYGLTANYQFNFESKGAMAPFLTAGAGIQGYRYGNGSSVSATSVLYGVGAGVRQKLGEQGTLRAEVRFDRNMEGKQGDEILIPEANHISVRLGFDLWGK